MLAPKRDSNQIFLTNNNGGMNIKLQFLLTACAFLSWPYLYTRRLLKVFNEYNMFLAEDISQKLLEERLQNHLQIFKLSSSRLYKYQQNVTYTLFHISYNNIIS